MFHRCQFGHCKWIVEIVVQWSTAKSRCSLTETPFAETYMIQWTCYQIAIAILCTCSEGHFAGSHYYAYTFHCLFLVCLVSLVEQFPQEYLVGLQPVSLEFYGQVKLKRREREKRMARSYRADTARKKMRGNTHGTIWETSIESIKRRPFWGRRADSNCEHLWVKHDLPWTPSPHWILSRRLLASALALVLSCVTANTTHCDWFAGCFDGLVIIEEMYLCGNKSSPCCVFCKKIALFHNQCCADRLLPLLWVQKADQWASCQNRSVMLDHPEIKQH